MNRRELLKLLGITGVGGIIATQLSDFSLANAERNSNPLPTPDIDLPKTEPRLRFVSLADTGTGNQGQYAVAKAMTEFYRHSPYPLALLAGDNIYNKGDINKIEPVFERPYKPLLQHGVNFYACLGNHDVRTKKGTPQVEYPHFNMGGRYYTFTRSIVQFFALDTTRHVDWKQQLEWLDRELRNSNAPWKIVFGHHNLYSSGVYGLNQSLISKLTPLFKRYSVQLYINGHEHHYERTKPINGTTYLTCGAGAKLRPVHPSDWTEYATSQLSFASYDVYADEIAIRGINKDGKIIDRALISRTT
ncbi:metallophosphoesterase [Euhalothece natronophila Z-M001]|uniref:Metallophosphoesterase n=1 Tax=Euhalothece natronophila Z-M001 TaxID=522448 RepID=A0A5B8NM93_9CHRO|nr:metallophosphoesterase [Euhalothece natronophila]QDZ39209.1 metallophosphoesterase [Euhalothece natronophila Z-M001]